MDDSIYDESFDDDSFGNYDSAEARLPPAYARARLRQQARALARRRTNTPPARYTPGAPPAGQGIRQAQAGIAKVEIENKVQSDVFTTAINNLNRRVNGNTNALAAGPLVNEVIKQFGGSLGELSTFLPFLPLLLTRSDGRRRSTVEHLTNPVLAFPLGVLALKLFNQTRGRSQRFSIFPASVNVKAQGTQPLLVLDQDNKVVSGAAISWNTTDPGKATVDSSGKLTGVSAGPALATATITVNGVAITSAPAMVTVS
jgi:hypothetical protein